MNSIITSFEIPILFSVLRRHFPDLEDLGLSLEALHVVSREYTGVGAYVNFSKNKILSGGINCQLGFDGEITIPKLTSGLGAVLAIDDGSINYLELFTYGDEQWDGDTAGALVIDSVI